MISLDEDALICDFAETYHIYDYKKLPVKLVASLASGLRDDSRIKMTLTGTKVTSEIMMLAAVVDRLSLLVWAQTKDASKGKNKPKPLLNDLMKTKSNVEGFDTGKEFEQRREALRKQIKERTEEDGN